MSFAMVNQVDTSRSPEWLLTVADGSSVQAEPEKGLVGRMWSGLTGLLLNFKSNVSRFTKRVWKVGADDPRKVIHAIKVGLALALVSVFYYARPLYNGVGGNAMWAVMTVVMIFDFTVGGSLYKGLNRTIATLSAGALACGIHWLASKSGEPMGQIILATSAFLLSSAATFSRFILTIKARFDYGIMIFILTFNLVAVSGYRVDDLLALAQQRMATVAIGVSICLIVCILVFPVWAGEDLHLLVIRNLEKLADSLEYSVAEYFKGCETANGNISSYEKSRGYNSVLNSKSSEDSLASLARWEPSHGPFKLSHPWNQYLKVGAAMRYCAYSVEALNSFILSEIQAPESIKKYLSHACTRLSLQFSKILKESANSLKTMKKSVTIELMMAEMNDIVEDVQSALRSFQSNGEEKEQPTLTKQTVKLIEALPLISVISLLTEISVRIEGIVDAVEDLADLAGFATADEKKQEKVKPPNNPCSAGP